MLVLSRQEQEVIVIGSEVRLTVLSIKGNQVRIGIDAPKSVTVHRAEIYDRIKAEKIEAGSVGPSDSE